MCLFFFPLGLRVAYIRATFKLNLFRSDDITDYIILLIYLIIHIT